MADGGESYYWPSRVDRGDNSPVRAHRREVGRLAKRRGTFRSCAAAEPARAAGCATCRFRNPISSESRFGQGCTGFDRGRCQGPGWHARSPGGRCSSPVATSSRGRFERRPGSTSRSLSGWSPPACTRRAGTRCTSAGRCSISVPASSVAPLGCLEPFPRPPGWCIGRFFTRSATSAKRSRTSSGATGQQCPAICEHVDCLR
jgi:hypothetical protein